MAKLNVNFLSYTLHRAVDLTVIIPSMCFPEMMEPNPTHKDGLKYPVLYLLHGYGNNHATWNGYTSVELYAEERNMAVVMLSGENAFYANHGGDNNYYDFISHELPEFILRMFPISDKKEDTYIAGLSMGGYGALLHGLSQSERFAAVGSFSGATRMPEDLDSLMPKTAPNVAEIARNCAAEDRRIPVYLSCGDQDGLMEANVEFRKLLEELNFDVNFVVGEGYIHEWRFWNREIENFLDWIPRSDEAYKALGGTRRKI